jgi:hypothetical protein
VDELVVTGMAYDEAARRESFAIIAREFGISGQSSVVSRQNGQAQ